MITVLLLSNSHWPSLKATVASFTAAAPPSARLLVVEMGSEPDVQRALGTISGDRVAFVYSERNGIYAAMNRGVSEVKTPYYLVLGLDDRFRFDQLDRIETHLSQHGESLLFLGVRKGPRELTFFKPEGLRRGPQGVFPSHTGGCVIRTDLHQRYGTYDISFRVVADGLFLSRCLAAGEPAGLLPEMFCDVGAGGFSKKHELLGEWESHRVRLAIGVPVLSSLGLLMVRGGKRVIKRLVHSE